MDRRTEPLQHSNLTIFRLYEVETRNQTLQTIQTILPPAGEGNQRSGGRGWGKKSKATPLYKPLHWFVEKSKGEKSEEEV